MINCIFIPSNIFKAFVSKAKENNKKTTEKLLKQQVFSKKEILIYTNLISGNKKATIRKDEQTKNNFKFGDKFFMSSINPIR